MKAHHILFIVGGLRERYGLRSNLWIQRAQDYLQTHSCSDRISFGCEDVWSAECVDLLSGCWLCTVVWLLAVLSYFLGWFLWMVPWLVQRLLGIGDTFGSEAQIPPG